MSELTNAQDNQVRLRAEDRVRSSPDLRSYAEIILNAARGDESDWEWIATASEGEILRWAEDLRDSERDEIARDEIPVETGQAWR
ncbi:hypothetical protein CCAX7_63350 [Capsulimonas corticalis]|uniref:Uncharacterized protein n=1 Tax=Capsulimonas corticalis TaxID=2219043 RepID=A0A402CWW4_9BACT|nr:hypothetical protein [Capsulimonas corticalis]BDI34284.1 hypothetical protein CCAX7_63350 [Capsulimonas corticalis]